MTEIDQEFVEVFTAEAEEHLQKMEQVLLVLEEQPNEPEHLRTMLRVAHTLKGNSACMGFDGVARAAHRLEDLLTEVRDGKVTVTAPLISLMLEALDVFRRGIANAVRGIQELSPQDLELIQKIVTVAHASQRPGVQTQSAETPRIPQKVPAPALTPGEAAPERGPAATAEMGAAKTLRIPVDRLDRMLSMLGEVSIARSRLRELVREVGGKSGEQLMEAYLNVERLSLNLQDQVLKTRMVSVGPLFRQFRRAVREAAAQVKKQVELSLEGEEVEVDTSVVELLRDPLTHMIRNAIDHGIESPAVRVQNGKSAAGHLTLSASHEAGHIIVKIIDDGQGLRVARIKAKAIERGLISESDVLTESQVFQLIFEAGFSTAETITGMSGRGVGMDVVRRNVEALRGTLTIESTEGKGATIKIRLPLTLAIINGFGVGVGDENYVIPLENVSECVELPRENASAKTGLLNVAGEAIPLVRLRDVFSTRGREAERQTVVVVEHQGDRFGVVVDALHGEDQAVIKPLNKLFRGIPGIAGSTILGSGRVALILDVSTLFREAAQRPLDPTAQQRSALSSGENSHVS